MSLPFGLIFEDENEKIASAENTSKNMAVSGTGLDAGQKRPHSHI